MYKESTIFGAHTSQVKSIDQDISLDTWLSQKGGNSTQKELHDLT